MNQLYKLLGLLISLSMLGSSGGFTALNTSQDANLGTPVVQENELEETIPDTGENQDQLDSAVEVPAPETELPPESPDQVPPEETLPAESDVTENPATGPPADDSNDAAPEGDEVVSDEGDVEQIEVPVDEDQVIPVEGDVEQTEAPAAGDEIITDDGDVEQTDAPAAGNQVVSDDGDVEQTDAPAEVDEVVSDEGDVEQTDAPAAGDEIVSNPEDVNEITTSTEGDEEVSTANDVEELENPVDEELIVVDEGDAETTNTPSEDEDTADKSGEESEEPDAATTSLMEAQATNIEVTITVADLEWNPIPGASVVAHSPDSTVTYGTGTTDSSGQLPPMDLPDQTTVSFTVTKDGFELPSIYWPVQSHLIDSTTTSITLFLDPIIAGTLTMVINSNNGLVTGATMQILQDGEFFADAPETPAGSGSYVSSKLLPGGTYEVVMSHPNYVAQPEWVSVQGPTTDSMYAVALVSGDITIQIKNRDTGALIPNATITVDPDGTAPITRTTGQDGTATFTNLAGGGHTAAISADGFLSIDEFFYVDGSDTVIMELFPAQAGTVTISVTERQGTAPVSGVNIIIRNEAGNQVMTLTTNVSGIASTDDLGFGRFYADLSRDGYLPNTNVPIWNSGGDDVSTTMSKIVTGPATVRVYNSDTNAGIGNASILVTETSSGDTQTITTNGQGTATFTASTGSYDFDVTADGFLNAHSSMTYDSSTTSVEISMESREPGIATLTIRSLVDNAALSGVEVSITNEAGDAVHTQTTGADGVVITPQLPGGVYTVSMSKDGYGSTSEAITIRGNLSEDIFMDVLTSGSFTVLVADVQTSVPISGATVTIYQAENVLPNTVMVGGMTQIRYFGSFGPVVASGTTVNGAFVSPELEPGYYIVWIEADGYQFDSDQAFKLNSDIQASFGLYTGQPTTAPDGNVIEETPDPETNPGAGTDPDDSNGHTDDSDEPGTTPNEPDADNGEDDQDNTATFGVLNVEFSLCANDACANMDTNFDGYTVTWTVTPQQTAATDEIDANKLAAVGMVGEPVSFAAMQQAQSFTITGVIQDGMAVGASEPVLVGTYTVCLNPIISGPNGESASIAGDVMCSDANVSTGGSTSLPFVGVTGSVAVKTPTDGNTEGSSDGETAQSGSTATDGQAASGDGAVSDLPNTGAGSAQGANNGMLIASLLMLTLVMMQLGIRRTSRRS